MSKRKTKPEDIRNPERYFNSFIATEVKRDKRQELEYHAMFDSLDEMMENEFAVLSGKSRMRIVPDSEQDSYLDDQSCTSVEEWMERMQSDLLSEAFLQLTAQQRAILFCRYYKAQTYREIGKKMGISHQAVENEERKAIKKLEKILG